MHMFGNSKITSRIDAQGNLVVESIGKKNIIEWIPTMGTTAYRGRK